MRWRAVAAVMLGVLLAACSDDGDDDHVDDDTAPIEEAPTTTTSAAPDVGVSLVVTAEDGTTAIGIDGAVTCEGDDMQSRLHVADIDWDDDDALYDELWLTVVHQDAFGEPPHLGVVELGTSGAGFVLIDLGEPITLLADDDRTEVRIENAVMQRITSSPNTIVELDGTIAVDWTDECGAQPRGGYDEGLYAQ